MEGLLKAKDSVPLREVQNVQLNLALSRNPGLSHHDDCCKEFRIRIDVKLCIEYINLVPVCKNTNLPILHELAIK